MSGKTKVTITPLSKTVYADTVSLYVRGYKEYTGVVVPRVEIEQMLQSVENETYVLLVNDEVRGGYTIRQAGELNILRAFILDPLARRRKSGYALFKHLQDHFGSRPILMCVYVDNDNAMRFAQRRGKYCTSFIDDEARRLDCYTIEKG